MGQRSQPNSFLRSRGRVAIVLGTVTLAITACSLIVDTKSDQCTNSGDCAAFAGTVCQSGVCVGGSSVVDSASDSPVGDGPNTGDGGDSGCVPKVPVTQEDFLNETCTGAQCLPFDDCARLGMCDGAALPALIPCTGGGC